MRAIILAGGLGTRFAEETHDKPKPMIKIGNSTLIEHIMNIYSLSGVTEFIIATGYKG
jgi:glucose-1-phosphate cytidylyltransferase